MPSNRNHDIVQVSTQNVKLYFNEMKTIALFANNAYNHLINL